MRVSTEDQAREGFSLPEQKERLEALNLRVKTLNDTIKEKDNEISILKSKIQDLKNMLDYWKDKFNKLISFICNFSLKILETFTAAFIISSAYLSESEKISCSCFFGTTSTCPLVACEISKKQIT